jgi:hypothetical protein
MTITKIGDKKAKGKWENGVNQRHFYNVLNGTSTLSLFDWKISSFFVDMGSNSFSSTIYWEGECIYKFKTKVHESHMTNIIIFLELLKKFSAKSTL